MGTDIPSVPGWKADRDPSIREQRRGHKACEFASPVARPISPTSDKDEHGERAKRAEKVGTTELCAKEREKTDRMVDVTTRSRVPAHFQQMSTVLDTARIRGGPAGA